MKMKLLVLATCFSCAGGVATAEEGQERFVRVAELEIDAAHADAFATAIREVGQASVRSEDGCLALYAVAEKRRSRPRAGLRDLPRPGRLRVASFLPGRRRPGRCPGFGNSLMTV